MGPLERVREAAARVAASYGLDIFDVELRREGGRQVLRVVLDRPGPNLTAEDSVSLDDCARVSEELSAIRRLDDQARKLEATARGPSFREFVDEEWRRSPEYGGRTVFDDADETWARVKKKAR